MCGIFACVFCSTDSSRKEMINVLLTGLHRLEYRGYDSAGIAVDGAGPDDPIVIKEVGTIAKLENRVKEVESSDNRMKEDVHLKHSVGIAHTRWATHGPPSRENSHPHTSGPEDNFLVVHNGIITNNAVLRDMLAGYGVKFKSQTDSETVAKLIQFLYDQMIQSVPDLSFPRLVMEVLRQLEGAYAFVFRSRMYPNELIACRLGSPLVVGTKDYRGTERDVFKVNKISQYSHSSNREPAAPITPQLNLVLDKEEPCTRPDGGFRGEYLFSSDAGAIAERTDKVFYMEDNDVVHVKNGNLEVFNFHAALDDHVLSDNRIISTLPFELETIMRGSFDHYMQKEIYEQPESLTSTMRGRIKKDESTGRYEIHLGGVKNRLRDILSSSRIIFVACGSSYHACLAARQVVEELTDVPVSVELASDFNDRKCPLFRSDTCVFVSQSGETKDTLESLSYARGVDAVTVGVVNVVGSEISRQTSCGIHLNAGSEIGVASTKAYTSQIVALVMFALQLSHDRNSKDARRQEILAALHEMPCQIESSIKRIDEVTRRLAKSLEQSTSILLSGRG
mmetsp:Transcript_1034/g.2687  ORF Transcript_1034/g.2687 Transcript_1034/m.2687 type:complete len:564 (-) Transcript_1034:1717-3408(-)